MSLYSFITNYKGGTYISQHVAPDLHAACDAWFAHTLHGGHIPELPHELFRLEYRIEMDEMPPVLIEGMQNIWYLSVLLEDDMMDVHILDTSLAAHHLPVKVA
jgi:hypothetical protein